MVLAKSLLGQVLVRKVGEEVVKGRIVETESYITGCRKFKNSYGPGIRKILQFDHSKMESKLLKILW